MTREEFSNNLKAATFHSHEKALAFVVNELRTPFTYLVALNQSFDGNPLANGEVIPQQIRARKNEVVGPLTHEEVIDLLWLNGLVPEWIDIIPWEASNSGLKFKLTCCGRFAEGKPLLYHEKEGYQPFHAPGVWSPPAWDGSKEIKQFDLNWHLRTTSLNP
jgi:hypothetical protein